MKQSAALSPRSISPDKTRTETLKRSKLTSQNKGYIIPSNDPPSKSCEEMLESMYESLGHTNYTRILQLFEKYCHFGKVNTSYGMDYSQFSTMLSQNELYDSTFEKTYCELTFNKVKGQNKRIHR